MIYEIGTKLTDKISGAVFFVSGSKADQTYYTGPCGSGAIVTSELPRVFDATTHGIKPVSSLDVQIGGDHYKKLGDYQPWEVLRRWLSPDEFRGYMKGTAIAYLARERDKGNVVDIKKAIHTLQGLVELMEDIE